MNTTQLRNLVDSESVGAFHALAEQTQLPMVLDQMHEPILVLNLGNLEPEGAVWRLRGVVELSETMLDAEGVKGMFTHARILLISHGPITMHKSGSMYERYPNKLIPYRTTQSLFLRDQTFTIESISPPSAGFRRIVAKARKAETTSAVGRR